MKGLSQHIKTLRRKRFLTLKDLSKKTGICESTLSRMENGWMTGTLESHMKLVKVFGISLPELYEYAIEKIAKTKDKIVLKKIQTFLNGSEAQSLTTDILQKKMFPILLKIKPKSCCEMEEYSPVTERFIYILKGSLEIRFENEKILLKQTESLYFNASKPHHVRNIGNAECWALSVMTPSSL